MRGPRDWARQHIRQLEAYAAARDLFAGGPRLYLDANESPYATTAPPPVFGLERYPDPRCDELRHALADQLDVEPRSLWIGNGSDEGIDLLLRTLVEPGEAVAICTPTYGVYEIAARAHGARVIEAPLDADFDLDVDGTARRTAGAKAIFLCSPNNPTGNRMQRRRIERLLAAFDGLLVLDEAYVEFSAEPSLVEMVAGRRNLAVLRTFSKAWGLAGARVGYMVADPELIELIDRINLPYPLSSLSAAAARRALSERGVMRARVAHLVAERGRMADRLSRLGFEVFPSDANFLLGRVEGAREVFDRLAHEFGIVVRYRGDLERLENCLRITVGRPEDTDRLCAALQEILG